MSLTDKGLWGFVAVAGGYCIVTMVLVPLLALVAGGYLATGQQYVAATAITVLGGVAGYGIYRWRQDAPIFPWAATTATRSPAEGQPEDRDDAGGDQP